VLLSDPTIHPFTLATGHWSTLAQTAPPPQGVDAPSRQAPTQSQPGTTGQPLGPANPQATPPPPGGLGYFLPIMLGLFLFMIVMSIMGSRKEKKKRAELLASLAKYDRVQTTGGMIGTIVDVKSDEVVIKVDESTNTKIHFARSAVQSILKKGPGRGGGGSEDSSGSGESGDAKPGADTLEPAEQIA